MLKIKRLSTQDDFDQLNQGDMLLIEDIDGRIICSRKWSIMRNNDKLIYNKAKNKRFDISRYIRDISYEIRHIYLVNQMCQWEETE